jgi:hypothetical protein
VDLPGALTLGSAGDMLDILIGLKSIAGSWGPVSTVPLPPEAAFSAIVGLERPTYCAVAMRGPRVAGVVIRGDETLAARVRPKVPGDTSNAVLTRLVEATIDRFGAKDVRITDPIVARALAPIYPGVRHVPPGENPAQGRAWALIVKAEKAEAPVVVPPPSDADAPLFGGRWAALVAPRGQCG